MQASPLKEKLGLRKDSVQQKRHYRSHGGHEESGSASDEAPPGRRAGGDKGRGGMRRGVSVLWGPFLQPCSRLRHRFRPHDYVAQKFVHNGSFYHVFISVPWFPRRDVMPRSAAKVLAMTLLWRRMLGRRSNYIPARLPQSSVSARRKTRGLDLSAFSWELRSVGSCVQLVLHQSTILNTYAEFGCVSGHSI